MECLHCGAEFEQRAPHQKFCSRKCQSRHSYKPRPRAHTNTCAVCGKEFEAKSNATKYCSPECYRAANPSKYKPNPVRQATCPICGAEFATGRQNQIYCSRLCCKAAERRRARLARNGQSHLEKFIPPAEAETITPTEYQPTLIDEIFPPFHIPREVIIPAAVAENRNPSIEELLDWIFSEERSA